MKGISMFVAVAATAAPAHAQVFERLLTSPFVPVPAPDAQAVASADFDGDGRVDLLLETFDLYAPDVLMLYRNESVDRFVLQQALTAFGSPAEQAAAGDFDGDGDIDLVRGVHLLRNDGGALQPVPSGLPFALIVGPSWAADLDGDGDDELLQCPGNVLHVYDLGQAGTFVDVTAAALPQQLWPGTIELLDADADADFDIALLSQTFQPFAVGLLRNDGAAHFTLEVTAVPGGSVFVGRISAGDLDGDGDQDLLVGGSPAPVTMFLNDGGGHFTGQTMNGGPDGFAVMAGRLTDWDLDGDADLVTEDGVHLMHQLQLPSGPSFATGGPRLHDALLLDLDGDLDVDAVAGSPLAVLRNTQVGGTVAHREPVVGQVTLEAPPSLHVLRGRRHALLGCANADRATLLVAAPSPTTTGYRPLTARPFFGVVHDVAVMPRDAVQGQDAMCVCTAAGPAMLLDNGGTLDDLWPVVGAAVGAPHHVAAGELDGQPGIDLVFGDASFAGPRMLTRDTFAQFVEHTPNLPAATPSAAPVFETVLLVDVDGDGDLDVVHELRVLRNDGQGQWGVGAELAALVPATVRRLLPIDFDGDADADLLAYGDGWTLLLQNDGATFHDATIGHLPGPEWAPCALASAGDVDGDGDQDLLLARNGRSFLLRNDGGVFVRMLDVGPAGVLVDADFDDRADLFTGTEVLGNRHTLLHQRHGAAPGVAWTLEVHCWRPATLPQLAVVAVGSRTIQAVQLPGIGQLEIDLDHAGTHPVALTSGRGELTFTIPLTPVVVGLDVVAQAAVVGAQEVTLTGVCIDTVR